MAEDHKDGDAAPAKKKSKLPLIVGALVLLIAIGGGAYYFLVMKPAAEAKAAEDAAAEEDGGSKAKGDKADKGDKGDAKKKKKKKKKSEKSEPPAYLSLDAFTVNLADVEQEHYLQATIVLQVGGESAVEELKKQNPMIRDTVLKLLSGSKAGDLRSVEGKQKLATDIIEQVAAAAEETGVEVPEIDRVFFTAFIIQ